MAGWEGGKPFLGHVDLIGTAFQDDVMATGFGEWLRWSELGVHPTRLQS